MCVYAYACALRGKKTTRSSIYMKFRGQVPPVVTLHAVCQALSRTGSYENPIC